LHADTKIKLEKEMYIISLSKRIYSSFNAVLMKELGWVGGYGYGV
jgi:hypothetical protein